MRFKPLDKQVLMDAIDGVKNPPRVPVNLGIWAGAHIYTGKNKRRAKKIIKRYPDDVVMIWARNSNMYPKTKVENKGLDEQIALESYDDLEKYLKRFQNPDEVKFRFNRNNKQYKIFGYWNLLFENHWNIRGMENALTDYYLYPNEVHTLFRKITDYFKVLIVKAGKEENCDAFFASDDLGMQTGSFFSNEIFMEFYYPYYKELVDTAHEQNMHFWLHTCGNVTNFLPIFIDLGIDVLHPIQKYAMDEVEIFKQIENKITIWYGLDVQQTIPYGNSQDVELEIKRVYDLFSKAKGRFIFTAGNALTHDCPIESFETLFITSHSYNPYFE